MKINATLNPQRLRKKTARVFELAGQKIRAIDAAWDPAKGTPVFTVAGKYTSRGWTEWTQGFQFGLGFLHFDATGDASSLKLARQKTVKLMASHVSHVGVHDHGFNNVSTYGNLRRLMLEGKIPHNQDELNFAELALKVSGAVQAALRQSVACLWTTQSLGLDGLSSYAIKVEGPLLTISRSASTARLAGLTATPARSP